MAFTCQTAGVINLHFFASKVTLFRPIEVAFTAEVSTEFMLKIDSQLAYGLKLFVVLHEYSIKRAPSGRDPRLHGKVIQSTTIFFKI